MRSFCSLIAAFLINLSIQSAAVSQDGTPEEWRTLVDKNTKLLFDCHEEQILRSVRVRMPPLDHLQVVMITCRESSVFLNQATYGFFRAQGSSPDEAKERSKKLLEDVSMDMFQGYIKILELREQQLKDRKKDN